MEARPGGHRRASRESEAGPPWLWQWEWLFGLVADGLALSVWCHVSARAGYDLDHSVSFPQDIITMRRGLNYI